MKIQFASDLHLEMSINALWLQQHPIKVAGDILILAGDTGYLEDGLPNWFLDWAADSFKQVLLIPGNHEYYHYGDVAKRGESWQRPLRDNVSYYSNKVVSIGDTDLVLSTLWTHIPDTEMFQVQRGLNDFHQVLYQDRMFTPDDYNREHDTCRQFIENSIVHSEAKHIVVVTHHVPTLQAVAPQHKGSVLNNAFVVDMSNLIAGHNIDFWIYGHSHTNIDTMIGNTHIVSNQLGYVAQEEHRNGFDNSKYIEVTGM